MKTIYQIFFVLFLIFFGNQNGLFAQKVIVMTSDDEAATVGPSAYYFEDKEHNHTFEQISKPEFYKNFLPSKQKNLNFGFSPSAFWVTFQVQNKHHFHDDWLLEISFPVLDHIEFYFKDQQQKWQVKYYGDTFPFDNRDIDHRNFIIPIDLPDTTTRTYFVRFVTKTTAQFPMSIESPHYFLEQEIRGEIAQGIFYGLMGVMVIYNLFVFLSLRDVNYLYYVVSILASTLYFSAKSGHAYQYIWFDYPWIGNNFILLTIGGWISTAALFTKYFLTVEDYSKILARLLDLAIIGGLAVIGLTFFLDYSTIARNSTNMLGLNAIVILTSSIVCWWKGNQSARFFIIAWTIYLLGTLLLVLKVKGLLPNNFYTDYAGEIGSAMEVILLSLALSDKYRIIRLEKENAQAEALEIQRKANEELEQKVIERTFAIEEQNNQLEFQNKEIHKQKENIESSIKYAQRIQSAMLPADERVAELLPESFVLFRPRDIVSGDFYWLTEHRGIIIAAAVDCTGHGVPGSFMSMMGNSLLNEIVNLREITSPDLILNELHLGVRRTLKQGTSQNRDGMDMTLCCIDHANKNLEFAGAKNPLFYMRNGILEEIKGDKNPIGGKQADDEHHRLFEKKTVPIDQPIVVYLFTDGYQDQFGGADGRKFMIKRFKELITSIHILPFAKQKEILGKEFDDWKIKTKQIDDVLVFGFKVE